MDWSYLQERIPFEKNFRWRGGQVSRVEAFADAVFALSIALFVVSTEVPNSYGELITTLWGFPAFALSFLLLVMVWGYHFIQFRRYGVEDATTTILTVVLLFVALFYVYPLKFMWAFLQVAVTEGMGTALDQMGLEPETVGNLLAIYGAGFVAMYVLLALMALHCLRLRDELELDEVEVLLTKGLIGSHGLMIGVGTLSVTMALLLPSPFQGFAGMAYMTLAFLHPLYGWWLTRRERAVLATMGPETTNAAPASEKASAAPES